MNGVFPINVFTSAPLRSDAVVHDSPSLLGKRVRLHPTLNEVNGLCSADQRFVLLVLDQLFLQFVQSPVRVNRSLNKCAQVCRELFGMLSHTLHSAVHGSVTVELRFDRIGFKLDEKPGKNANTL